MSIFRDFRFFAAIQDPSGLDASVLDQLSLMVFCKDGQNGYTYTVFNRVAEQVTELSAKKVIARRDGDLVSGAGARASREVDDRTIELGKVTFIPEDTYSK